MSKSLRSITKEDLRLKDPEMRRLREPYLLSLDLTLAIEGILQDGVAIKEGHEKVLRDFHAVLRAIQPHIAKQQARMEKVIIMECGGIYQGAE